jgi:hypothetical protein
MFFPLKKLQQRWRDLHLNLQRLEKRQRETERILDISGDR